MVCAGLHGILVSQPDLEVVGEASNGLEAVELVAALRPNVVLMDLKMPEMDGVSAISRIVADHSETYVLVLTTYESDAEIVRAMGAGATGNLLKDTPREELCRAIRAAARGNSVLAPVVAARLMKRVRDPDQESLSRREVEVCIWCPTAHATRRLGTLCISARPPSNLT